MAHEFTAIFLHERIERVQRFGVGLVEPGGEYVEAAEQAAMFVAPAFVGVVRATLIIFETAQSLALDAQAGHGPDAALLVFGDEVKQVGNIARLQRTESSVLVGELESGLDGKLFGREAKDKVLGDVVSDR